MTSASNYFKPLQQTTSYLCLFQSPKTPIQCKIKPWMHHQFLLTCCEYLLCDEFVILLNGDISTNHVTKNLFAP